MADKITEDELYGRILKRKPELASFDRAEVMARVYQRKPELRSAVISAPEPMTSVEEPQFTQSGAAQTVGLLKKPGVLPAVGMLGAGMAAAPLTAGMSLPWAVAGGAAASGLGAMGGEAARQAIAGEPMSVEKMGTEGAIGASGEAAVRGAFIGGSALMNAIKGNPFIRKGVSKLLASSTAGKESWANIAKALDRGVGKDIPGYEARVSDIMSKTQKAAVSETPLIERDAIGVLEKTQAQLKNLRTLAGKEVGDARKILSANAKSKGIFIDQSDISKEIFSFTQELKNADLGSVAQVKPIIDNLDGIATSMAKNPAISVEEAIKRKEVINKIFANFKSGRMDVSQDPIVKERMQKVAKALSDKIADAAVRVGDKNFAKVNRNFGEFADHYDLEIEPLLGSDKGQVELLKKFHSIANGLNTQSLKNEFLESTSSMLPKGLSDKALTPVRANIEKLTDQGVLYNLYRDLAASQSSELIGKYRLLLGPMTKGYVKWAGDIKPLATGPSMMVPAARAAAEPNKEK